MSCPPGALSRGTKRLPTASDGHQRRGADTVFAQVGYCFRYSEAYGCLVALPVFKTGEAE
jgi:hypothetical protein